MATPAMPTQLQHMTACGERAAPAKPARQEPNAIAAFGAERPTARTTKAAGNSLQHLVQGGQRSLGRSLAQRAALLSSCHKTMTCYKRLRNGVRTFPSTLGDRAKNAMPAALDEQHGQADAEDDTNAGVHDQVARGHHRVAACLPLQQDTRAGRNLAARACWQTRQPKQCRNTMLDSGGIRAHAPTRSRCTHRNK